MRARSCRSSCGMAAGITGITGFTLIEVLVAVLVLAVGIVGGLSMQLAALRTRQQSAMLAQAAWLASGMAERLRANPEQLRLPDGANPYLAFDYDALQEPAPAAPSALCYQAACDSAQLAAFDLYEIESMMREHLPAGRAVMCRDADLWSGGRLRWDCSGGAGAPVVIKLGWHARNPDGTPARDADGVYAPAVALVVGTP